VKSVTIQINDLFEFAGQPIPARWRDNAVIEAAAHPQSQFLRQPVRIHIGENTVTVSFSEESPTTQDEASRQAERVADPGNCVRRAECGWSQWFKPKSAFTTAMPITTEPKVALFEDAVRQIDQRVYITSGLRSEKIHLSEEAIE